TQFVQKFPFPSCDSLETILEDKTVDAVLVLTPPNTHLELVERFAAAGKHILLEKPLEVSLKKSEQLVKAASAVKLGIVLQHRFRPGAEKLREMLPELGRLVSASAAIPNWRPQSYYDQPGRGTRARDGGGRRNRRRSDGVPARLAPRRADRLLRCDRERPSAEGERRGGAQGAPLHRRAVARPVVGVPDSPAADRREWIRLTAIQALLRP